MVGNVVVTFSTAEPTRPFFDDWTARARELLSRHPQKRSALSMVALLARFHFPMRIFGSTLEGSQWLVAQLAPCNPELLDAKTLMLAAEVARNAHRRDEARAR